ncbi:hypothetical protein V5740_13450 [Croceibacterium sp. TMG7-5b_MA50]|uniref:hypothetical protein n=1 Tax=Croceibacterium sp. TMG7-5b_MA50 TaxID=3121290 RepID=UPI0032221D2D
MPADDPHGTPAATGRPWLTRRHWLLATGSAVVHLAAARMVPARAQAGSGEQAVTLRGDAGGPVFDGIGVVNGGGATSVLLKDYPEPQRSQILDLVYKPKFGASVSALLVEIPGDGNATQGSMPSHMHTRDDLNHRRGYTWWIMREAKRRNAALTLDGTAWSAPGWIGTSGELFDQDTDGFYRGDRAFFSRDTIDYYLKWLDGLHSVWGLRMDAIGVRNEKGVSYGFVKAFRRALDDGGHAQVRLHAFDNWPEWKLRFVDDMQQDPELRDAIDVISAHTFYSNFRASPQMQQAAASMGKPIWNTEDHVYRKGFAATIGIVQSFNHNYIFSGATKVVNWYDIAGLYPIEPYPEDPATVLAHSPWSGHYRVREALWGYAHYGQFSQVGWTYLNGGCGTLDGGGSVITLMAPRGGDYSIILETTDAPAAQQVRFQASEGLSDRPLCVWRSTAAEQFVRLADIAPVNGTFTILLEPDAIYTLSTTTGQQKGGFTDIPEPAPFPFPYRETFESYTAPEEHGYLPRYTADIAGAFEITDRPDGGGKCLRQVVPVPTISWAPDWQPYTIIGDADWGDYEVSTEVWLNPGDTAAVMGRINHVGTGYGFIPKGYFLELGHDGACRLVVIRGKKDPKALVGDAEQQALIRAGRAEGEGGERVLAASRMAGISPGRWHRLTLRMQGSTITGLVDGQEVLTGSDALYARGMAGLLAGGGRERLSTPYFATLLITDVGAPVPPATPAGPRHSPIYAR